MIAVIFEVEPRPGRRSEYLDLAAQLRPLLETIDGFIAIERFESLAQPGKILSLSFWRDEQAVRQWRTLEAHRTAPRRRQDATAFSPPTASESRTSCAITVTTTAPRLRPIRASFMPRRSIHRPTTPDSGLPCAGH